MRERESLPRRKALVRHVSFGLSSYPIPHLEREISQPIYTAEISNESLPGDNYQREKMAQEIFIEGNEPLLRKQRPGGAAVVMASATSVALGGPLLGMMGFTIMASLALLLFSSPFLLLFSPLLLFALFVICTATLGFAAAAAMAVTAAAIFAWLITAARRGSAAAVSTGLTESGRQVKTQVFPSGPRTVIIP